VVWDRSVDPRVLPPPSAPFTVQVTSPSMPRPATVGRFGALRSAAAASAGFAGSANATGPLQIEPWMREVGAPTPWHQDVAFRDPRFEYTEINMWVALQDVTAESGCLRYVPGSHSIPVLPHHSLNDDRTSQIFECVGNFDESTAVACPLPAGGCSIHLPGTLHSAGPNVSLTPRLAYIMVFGIAPKPAKEPQVYPWLDQKETPAQARKRRWMRRGGVFVTVWRRLRRGDLNSWQSAVYGLKRIARILRRGV